MQAQLPGFHARKTDPDTSKAAGQMVSSMSVLRALRTARELVKVDGNNRFTDGQLSLFGLVDRNIIARRRKDLVELGFVAPLLRDGVQERAMGRRGRPELVWCLTEKGWEVEIDGHV